MVIREFMNIIQKDLHTTIQGLNAGIHIKHIATFNLFTCQETENPDEIIGKKEFEDFDIIPVRGADDTIVGVIEKPQSSDSQPKANMFPIKVSMLVSSEASLISTLKVFKDANFKLVLGEKGIEGIVTKSDLLKLPVRIVGFSLISNLESLMARLIEEKIGSDLDCWEKYISKQRHEKMFKKYEKLKNSSIEPRFVELLEFCDKREVLRKYFKLGKSFTKELKGIEELRNSIAHSTDYINSDEDIKKFISTIELIEEKIVQVAELKDKRISKGVE
jgi:predicted transcriptional regulator